MLTMLEYGDAGAGKSWLGASTPAPRLILDAEGRARYLPGGAKVYWDPIKDQPPVDDGTWETCIVKVKDFNTLLVVYQWLQSGQHPFVSVTIDSLTEAQKRYIDSLVGMNQLDMQDWGSVLRHLESLVRNYRDLVDIDSNPVTCVIFICGETEDEGKKRPLLQGALRKQLPYLVDVCGYLYTVQTPEGVIERNLLIQSTPQVVAKDGTDRLKGPVIVNPNITTMFEELK